MACQKPWGSGCRKDTVQSLENDKFKRSQHVGSRKNERFSIQLHSSSRNCSVPLIKIPVMLERATGIIRNAV